MENFNATCPQGSVIKMQHAHYGRMRVGRCLSTNYLVGCYANALPFVDAKCSGQQHCEFSIMDPQLYAFQPCRKDLMSYLEASYTCVPVATWSHRQCENNGILPVEASDGHLQFNLGPSIPAGSASCPYHVTTQPGQKLQFNAFNFQTLRDFCTEIIPIPKTCDHQIVFQEGDRMQSIELCEGRQREEVIYTSQTNEVTVHLKLNLSQIALHGNPYGCFKTCDNNKILLSHKPVGCADLGEIPDADVLRSSDQKALVKCRGKTQHTFTMMCKNNQWEGDIINCSHPIRNHHPNDVINGNDLDLDIDLDLDSTAYPDIADDVKVFSFNFSKTSSIAIAISCGLLFGLIIGIVLLFALRNKRKSKSSRPPSPVLDIEASISKSSSRCSTRGSNGSNRASNGSPRGSNNSRNNGSNGSSHGNGSIGNGSLMIHGLFVGNGSLPGSSIGNGSSNGSQRGGSPRDSNSSRASNIDNYIYEV